MGGRSPLHAARRAHRVPVLALLEAALGAIILAAGLAVALTSAGSACATEDPSPPPPPPLAPGFAYATLPGTELTFDLTLGGSIDGFAADALEAKLRPELGCMPEWCTLTFPSVVAVLGTRRVCVQGRRPHPTLTTRLDDGASPVPQPWPPTGLRLWL